MLTRLRQPWAAACLLVALMGIGGFWAWSGGGGKRQAGAEAVRQVHKIEQSPRLALEEAGQAGGK